MEPVLTLGADHTHLYPGARLTIQGGSVLPDRATEAVVAFRDHAHAFATVTLTEQGMVLGVEEYTTAAGTTIAAKRWLLVAGEDRTWTVRSRLDAT